MSACIDVSFDCVGIDKTMTTVLSATRSGGKVCLVGLAQGQMTIPLTPAAARYLIKLAFCDAPFILYRLLSLKL